MGRMAWTVYPPASHWTNSANIAAPANHCEVFCSPVKFASPFEFVSLIPQTLPALELDFGVSAGLLMHGQARDIALESA